MLKNKLLLGSAVSMIAVCLASGASYAQGRFTDLDGDVKEKSVAKWYNKVNVSLSQDISVNKSLNITGTITITGSVDVDGLAQATVDNKQISEDNSVQFEDYQNVFMSSDVFWEPEPNQTSLGAKAAIYDNNASVGQNTLSAASGNIGLNVAAGDYNMQENVASIASALSASDALKGAAEAQVFSLQSLTNNGFNDEEPGPTDTGNALSNSAGFEVENTVITNDASIGNNALTDAEGNIGVNVAGGAFNQQKNALAMASIDRGILAEAHAAIQQASHSNASYHENTVNNAKIGDNALVGAIGNIGVNIAAGVGNQQLNSLAVSSAVFLATPSTDIPDEGSGGGTGGGSQG